MTSDQFEELKAIQDAYLEMANKRQEEAFAHPNHKKLQADPVKQACDIAKQNGGNMTGSIDKIEKIKKGLSKHPKVQAALQLANESFELTESSWPAKGESMKTTATVTKNKDGSTTTAFPDGTWKIESKGYKAEKRPTNLVYTHSKSDVAYQNLVYKKGATDNYQLNKEEVEEEIEELDEVSMATLDSYRKKAFAEPGENRQAGRALAYDKSDSHGDSKVKSSEEIANAKSQIKTLIKPEHHSKYPIHKITSHTSARKIYRDASAAGHLKEEVELEEANKEQMEVYHTGYSAALQHAGKHLNKQGYKIHPDDWQQHISHGPSKPSEGKTVRLHVPLHKDGVKSKKVAHIQVYNRGNTIPNNNELNMYVR